ncbi:MAG TPA: cupredoxin domain-containing protein [Solirubrobacteraceae bacterium]|jgi:plastocyanin|nr:cupredoxin domain-containing protein [Solirubrobacteraceae bacterium]
MKNAPLALVGAVVLTLLAGCGSNGSGGSTETTIVTVAGKTSTVVIANGKAVTQPQHTGLQADTTPKFGTAAAGEPVQGGIVQIVYRDIAIDPDVLKVKVGSSIRWTNEDPGKCNVTSEGGPYKFASKDIGAGQSFELKVEKPGVIHYECTYYPTTMNGTIEVIR